MVRNCLCCVCPYACVCLYACIFAVCASLRIFVLVVAWHRMLLCVLICLSLGNSRLSPFASRAHYCASFCLRPCYVYKFARALYNSRSVDPPASLITVLRGALHAALIIMQPPAPRSCKSGAHNPRDQSEHDPCFIPVSCFFSCAFVNCITTQRYL